MPGGKDPLTVEGAAAAFAEGDADKKISMLKRAVVNLTRHKAELEQQCAAHVAKVSTLEAQLGHSQQQNNALLATVQSNSIEIDALKKKIAAATAAASSSNVASSVASAALKGITNLIPLGNSGADNSGDKNSARGPVVATAAGRLALSAEDQQRMFEENEALHIQMFELKSNLEGQIRALSKTNASQAASITSLKAAAAQSEASAASSKQELEALRHAAREDRMIAHFLMSSSQLRLAACDSNNKEDSNDLFSPMVCASPGYLDRHTAQFLSTKIDHYLEMFTSLLSGVGTLITALDDSARRIPRSANADENQAVRERLRLLRDAHQGSREAVASAIGSIRDCLSSPASSSWSKLEECVQALVRSATMWLTAIRHNVPILVDCAVALLPRDHSVFVFGRGTPLQAAGSRDVYVSLLSESLGDVVSAAIGAIRTAGALVGRIPAAVSFSASSSSVRGSEMLDWCVLLWWVLWRGCETSCRLAMSCSTAHTLMSEMAQHCSDDRAQIALDYLARIVQAVADTSAVKDDARTSANSEEAHNSGDHCSEPAKRGRQADEYVAELKEALRLADQSAVRHYVQLQRVLLELHDQQGVADGLRQELLQQRRDAAGKEADLQHVVGAYEEQIRLLSDRLADLVQ